MASNMRHSVIVLSTCLLVGTLSFADDKAPSRKSARPAPKPAAAARSAEPTAFEPVGADGRTLNLGLETGTLLDWLATGDAFEGQPVRGGLVRRRRGDMESGYDGQFWIGTFEVAGDEPQGTLTSAPIVVTHPFASFLVGGGKGPDTRVEIVLRDSGEVVFKASGQDDEAMRRAIVDLSKYLDQQIFVRIIDHGSVGWGHVNFDDFQLHATRPRFTNVRSAPPVDEYTNDKLSPEEAAKAMTLPEGFSVKLFAGEPDVQQPIAFTIDDRGRLWVAEAYGYPNRQPEGEGLDRILILEDVDGDGHFDKRSVFAEKLNLVSGLAVGFGGVWVGAAPHLLFIPDKNQDDQPDGPPQVLLDGWGYQDTHETLNAFNWGPDGWLYGCHGVFTQSNVGKPGAPDSEREKINAGIWRYHPTDHRFEVFAYGTSNPWGVDFNDEGQTFLTACVIPHLFHIIQGARYHRQAGPHFSPYTFDDIKTIARHRHWIGSTPHGGNNRSDAAGGGHAHAGAMIYLGGQWPERYRNQIFMNNIHGARINEDLLIPEGSGYAGDRAPDFLLANDRSSQILSLQYGPDGQVYMIDWYDLNQCHNRNPGAHDRSNGRIFKVSYEGAKPVQADLDLQQLGDLELVELQHNDNEWYVRHARRILQERAAQGKLDPRVHQALAAFAFTHPKAAQRLRGLWTLHVTGGLSDTLIKRGLENDEPIVRAWTIQLAMEDGRPTAQFLDKFSEMAANDPSQVVRLYLSSAMQRIPLDKRWDILASLVGHAEDAGDHNLPLMYWYAAEPLATEDASRAFALASESKVPILLSFMARRIASIGTPEAMTLLVDGLNQLNTPGQQLLALGGINEALEGRRRVEMPAQWPKVSQKLTSSSDVLVRNQAQALAVTFGDPSALKRMRTVLADRQANIGTRRTAFNSLMGARDPELPPTLQALIADSSMRADAIRGLAAYDDAETPQRILEVYPNLTLSEKRDALNTLSSRPAYAAALLNAMGTGTLQVSDVSADVARQIRNLGDQDVTKRLGELWGVVRETSEDKAALIQKYTRLLSKPRPGRPADPALGRAVFAKTCQQCHKLFGTGGDVGPELTGSNRANLDYLLANVLDPSALMSKEYQSNVIATDSGRVITGIIAKETDNALTVKTANETLVIPRNEIDEMRPNDKSMMPDDLWSTLSEPQIRSLVAYLASPTQVEILATPDTVPSFFNGKDLTGWDGNPELWSVDENGEIVGKSQGLNHNEFLRSQMIAIDFELTLEVKLVDNVGNSGIQFRSRSEPNGLVSGYQADAGVGWWGKLYEEHGRALLWDKSGEQYLKPGEWNTYRIVAVGDQIRTYLNGNLCVDLKDPDGAKRGIIAFQLHSGGPTEVRFRNLQLKLDPKLEVTAR